MDNFIISLNAVLPTFLLMAAGYLLRRIGLADERFLKQVNRVTFMVFLPVMLFRNIYSADIRETLNLPVIALALGALVILFFLLCLIVPRVVHDNKQKGVIIQGIFRSNYLIFGVSIVTNMFGEEKAAIAAMLSAVLVPSYNFLAVIVLEAFTNGGKIDKKNTVLSILKNPLIIASVLGIIVAISGLQFPEFLDQTFNQLGRVATPLALIVLGGDFRVSALKGRLFKALAVSLIKLVAVPAAMIPAAVMIGLRDEALMAVVIAGASPVAVSSYIMAQQADADYELAGQIVMFSSFLCLFTMFGWIYLLKTLGFI
ncbi:AEC family transporter [Massiliimalia massiliensis]|uniref:AEC family transporter n=1 Tax=Massiliimalia massiliensis TaxID=1852384 RepID=UPI000986B38A|nr:AEC family transporter [Massiliimalia massiliensis]